MVPCLKRYRTDGAVDTRRRAAPNENAYAPLRRHLVAVLRFHRRTTPDAARPAHKDLEGGEKSSGMLREPQHERKTFNHFYRSPRGSRRANEGLLRNLLG